MANPTKIELNGMLSDKLDDILGSSHTGPISDADLSECFNGFMEVAVAASVDTVDPVKTGKPTVKYLQ